MQVTIQLGAVFTTPDALEKIPKAAIRAALARHRHGDWGCLDPKDRASNNRAVKSGGRILSEYHAPDGTKFWILTEADRSYTTVMLPTDY